MLVSAEVVTNINQLTQPSYAHMTANDPLTITPHFKSNIDELKEKYDNMQGQHINFLQEESQPTHSVNRGILSKFHDVIMSCIDRLFMPRLFNRKNVGFQDRPTLLKDLMNDCVKSDLDKESIAPIFKPDFVESTKCFKDRMDKLSQEFLSEYSAMSRAIEVVELIDSNHDNVWANSITYTTLMIEESVAYQGIKQRQLASKLQTAAEECIQQTENEKEKNRLMHIFSSIPIAR